MRSLFARKGAGRKAAFVAALAAVLPLAGCGGGAAGGGGGVAQGGSSGGSSGGSGVTLHVVAANHPWTTAIKPMLGDFTKKTGINVDLQSYGEDQLSNQLTVRFTAGNQDIDVAMYRPLQEGKLFAQNGWLADITDKVKGDSSYDWADFQDGPQKTVTVDGKIVGAPLVTEREILYYRKDLLKQAGLEVPKTLDELKADAAKLTDKNKGIFGFVARGQRAAAVTQFSSFLYSMGGSWTTPDGKSAVGSPEAIKAYDLYGSLLRQYGPPGVLNMSWPQAIGIFAQGKAALYTEADSLYTNLLDKSKSVVSDKVGYAQFPAGPAGSKPYNVSSWALGINAKSSNMDAAVKFVEWATSKDVVAKTQSQGIPGARTSVWQSPDGTSGFPPELVDVIKKSAEVGIDHDRPLVVKVGKARDIVGGPIVASISGDDVAAAAKKADADFADFLKSDSAQK